jgi:hypothetical protein
MIAIRPVIVAVPLAASDLSRRWIYFAISRARDRTRTVISVVLFSKIGQLAKDKLCVSRVIYLRNLSRQYS